MIRSFVMAFMAFFALSLGAAFAQVYTAVYSTNAFAPGQTTLQQGGKYRCTSFNPIVIPYPQPHVGLKIYYHDTPESAVLSTKQMDGRYFLYTITKNNSYPVPFDVYQITLQATDANWRPLRNLPESILFFPYNYKDYNRRGLNLWTQTSADASLSIDGISDVVTLGETFVIWWTNDTSLSISGTLDVGSPSPASFQIRPVVFCDPFFQGLMSWFPYLEE